MPDTERMDATTATVVAGLETVFAGLVDSAELVSKSGPDGSELHIPGAGGTQAQVANRHRRQAQIGVASNLVGIGAGAGAVAQGTTRIRSIRRAAQTGEAPEPGVLGAGLARAAEKAPKLARAARIATSPKAVAVGAGAALGLQAAALGGDAVANRVLAREARRKQQPVAKAINPVKMVGQRFKIMRSPKPPTQSKGIEGTKALARKYHKSNLAIIAGTGIAAGGAAGYSFGRAPEGKLVPDKEDLLHKGVEIADVVWTGEISKLNKAKQQAFGWANVSMVDGRPVLDRQGDFVPLDEMEDSAYHYVLHSRQGGEMHERDGDAPRVVSEMIESFVATPEKYRAIFKDPDDPDRLLVDEDVIKRLPQGWWYGQQIHDKETWERVEKRERTGFSVHGKGMRIPISDEQLADAITPGPLPARQPSPAATRINVFKAAPVTDAGLRRRKKAQARFAETTAVLGLSALGSRGAAVGVRRILPRVKVPTPATTRVVHEPVPVGVGTVPVTEHVPGGRRQLMSHRTANRVARKLDTASTGALTLGAGIGGVGGLNFAGIQRAESKRKAAPTVPVAKGAPMRIVAIAKAENFDPEARRQRRARNEVGATGLAAGAAGVQAVRETKPLRRALAGTTGEVKAGYKRSRRSAKTMTRRTSAIKVIRRANIPGKLAAADRTARPEQVAEAARISHPVRRAIATVKARPSGRAALAGAAAAGLGTAAVAGERHRERTAPSYRPGEWYR